MSSLQCGNNKRKNTLRSTVITCKVDKLELNAVAIAKKKIVSHPMVNLLYICAEGFLVVLTTPETNNR